MKRKRFSVEQIVAVLKQAGEEKSTIGSGQKSRRGGWTPRKAVIGLPSQGASLA